MTSPKAEASQEIAAISPSDRNALGRLLYELVHKNESAMMFPFDALTDAMKEWLADSAVAIAEEAVALSTKSRRESK